MSGVEVLNDGRVYCWIRHDVVRGVTPEMLVWWFKNLEGTVMIDGIAYDRYRVWHPRDHLFAKYARKSADGTVGVGSVIHLAEMLDARPDYLVHIYTEITKLDETDELGDKDTSDLYTGISRGVDKLLWFVEAHNQA